MFESSLSLFLNFCFLHDLFRFFSVSNTLRQQGVANSELLTFVTLSSTGGRGATNQLTYLFEKTSMEEYQILKQIIRQIKSRALR